jgi:uncharacterized protein
MGERAAIASGQGPAPEPLAALPGFMVAQYAFAAHLRDPAHCPAPDGIADRRMAVYRELIFSNVNELLAGAFPVLHGLLPPEGWRAMVRDFLVRHRARSPLFLELAQEFLDYLHRERGDWPDDPPFLLELAHYEWVELALLIAPDDPGSPDAPDCGPDLTGIDPNGDLLAGAPAVSPLAWSLAYRFPVHRIGPGDEPSEPPAEPTRLLVYRDRTDRVQFMEVNAVTQRLIELLRADPGRSGRAALELIAAELAHPDPEQAIGFGAELLAELRARAVVLGSRRVAGAQDPHPCL